MRRFNIYDNRDGSVVALNEYATCADNAIQQISKRSKFNSKYLRAEIPVFEVAGF